MSPHEETGDWADDIASLYLLQDSLIKMPTELPSQRQERERVYRESGQLTRELDRPAAGRGVLVSQPGGACRCDIIPERPCPARITQEDLLCDACRAARAPGMIHASFTLTGLPVVTTSHVAISSAGIFAPDESSSASLSG